ncbi:hypothetical protein NU118_000317 [Salmonella enterica]|nr:hypothetical protein [Salmonella enterica]
MQKLTFSAEALGNEYATGVIRASKVGENGIMPNTWYQLDKDGEFVKCE